MGMIKATIFILAKTPLHHLVSVVYPHHRFGCGTQSHLDTDKSRKHCERNQTQKATQYTKPSIYNVQSRKLHGNKSDLLVCKSLEHWRLRNECLMDTGGAVGSGECSGTNGDAWKAEYAKKRGRAHFKVVTFMLCEFYLYKTIITEGGREGREEERRRRERREEERKKSYEKKK